MKCEGIKTKNRRYFKNEIKNISNLFTVAFRGNNATIKYNTPYNITEEVLSTKGKHIKEYRQFIRDFLRYQFNNED